MSINSVNLVGRLTADPEVRKTNTGLSVCQFTIALDRIGSRNAEPGQQTADFPQVVAWRQSADFIGQYGHKGDSVAVEGRIQTRTYDKQDGTKAYVTEVVANRVELIGGRRSNGNDNPYQTQQTQVPAQQQNNFENQTQRTPYQSNSDVPLDISADDLPF